MGRSPSISAGLGDDISYVLSGNGKATYNFQFDGENKNHSCPLSYSFCMFSGSLSGNMAFIASSLPSFIAVS